MPESYRFNGERLARNEQRRRQFDFRNDAVKELFSFHQNQTFYCVHSLRVHNHAD